MNPGDPPRARRGSVAVEAAAVVALLMLAATALLDAGRYVQHVARADRVAAGLADLAARSGGLRDREAFDALSRNDDLGTLFELARRMAEPLALGAGGRVALASISETAGGRVVNWARASAGADDLPGLDDLPPLPAGADFVVAEATLPFETYTPGGAAALRALGLPEAARRLALRRPRGGALTRLEAP